ncbi:hypothetical protein H106_02551 [Trichophyton rubrum CBS 735.88]|nr:hypothetical protein H106_02551 [Trichophyton rubrum CBS 735.88]
MDSARTGSGVNQPHTLNPNNHNTLLPRIEETSSQLGGTFQTHRRAGLLGGPLVISGTTTHKGRSFGQSHWVNLISLFDDICGTVEQHLQHNQPIALSNIEKCKALARTIKPRRVPSGPINLTLDLPSKQVSDELVDCYLQTIESVYRILHIPTFRRDYETLFLSAVDPAVNNAFVVQVKLVLAIGAVTYDKDFSLRALANKWIYEAQAWLLDPKFKLRSNIQSLQSHLLLLFAQKTVDIDGDPMWVSVGTLLRRAIYMGLHKDLDGIPGNTLFVAEMRRRVWNTILEVCLQSSLTSGGPPLFSIDDFDTKSPRNFDDEQIEDSTAIKKNEFTQTSISMALRDTLPQRLAVITFLNSHGSLGTYETALQLDKELRSVYKSLCKTIQGYVRRPCPLPLFEFRAVDLIMQRYLSCCIYLFFGISLQESAYTFTRKAIIEAASKIWHSVYQISSFPPRQSNECLDSSPHDRLTLLATCGSGFYRTALLQATLLMAVELRAPIQDSESLVPIPLSQDLFTVLKNAKAWSIQCIEAGETNIKGHLLIFVIDAHIQALLKYPVEDCTPRSLIGALEDASAASLSILSRVATMDNVEKSTGVLHEMPLDNMGEGAEDWRFMVGGELPNISPIIRSHLTHFIRWPIQCSI